jgi:hypothetical protein
MLPSSRPKTRVFTRSPNMERVATVTPSRGLRHPAGVTVIGAEALSFCRKNLHHTWYLGPRPVPEPSFQHTICALTMPKRRQHQEPSTPTPRHLHGPKERAITTATPLAVKTPYSPPSRAAALASEILHPSDSTTPLGTNH